MTNHRSAGSFCSIVVSTTTGSSRSVESQDVAALGNGAEVFCASNRATYRYDSGSSQAAIASSDLFVPPLTGGGCWFKQGGQTGYAQSVLGTVNMISNVTPSLSRRWTNFPTGVANGYRVPSVNPLWSLDTTTGAIVYNGPSGQLVLVTAQISVQSSLSHQIEFDFETNLSLTGTTTDTDTAVQAQVLPNGTLFCLSSFITTGNGASYQHVFRDLGVPSALTFIHYQVQIVSISP